MGSIAETGRSAIQHDDVPLDCPRAEADLTARVEEFRTDRLSRKDWPAEPRRQRLEMIRRSVCKACKDSAGRYSQRAQAVQDRTLKPRPRSGVGIRVERIVVA